MHGLGNYIIQIFQAMFKFFSVSLFLCFSVSLLAQDVGMDKFMGRTGLDCTILARTNQFPRNLVTIFHPSGNGEVSFNHVHDNVFTCENDLLLPAYAG